jgi:exodeoxyribonuclease III
MHIISWNVNSVRARLPVIERFLQDKKPDLLLLQETKVEDQLFPQDFFESFGYNIAVYGQKSYNGVAIASLSPLEDVRCFQFAGLDQARCIEAYSRGVRWISVYIPNGQEVGSAFYDKKILFLNELAVYLKRLQKEGENVCIGGDFNVAFFEEDIWEKRSHQIHLSCTTVERKALRSLLFNGWIDAFPRVLGQKSEWTWWDYRNKDLQNDRGWKIDTFLLSPWLADRQKESVVEKQVRFYEKTSDHAPVSLYLQLDA